MWGRTTTVCFKGLETIPIDVQAKITPGLPAFHIVGLPDKAIAESKERVRSALHSLGISLPPKRIVINLAPADLRKEGSHYDVPIALALLLAMNAYEATLLASFIVMGELALNGAFVRVGGALGAALYAHTVGKSLICPEADGGEAMWAGSNAVIAAPDLLSLNNHLKGTQVLPAPTPHHDQPTIRKTNINHIQGHATAKHALLIAAAGGHNMLMTGPPGVGKSMLANCLPDLLPALSPLEALETTMIHSLSSKDTQGFLHKKRPFRAPHHALSTPALIGGGLHVRPGEISLAHNGVLFLDELAEFQRNHLEALRQPLESGKAVIARANDHVTYPAHFQLIAAMNPCPCGYYGHPHMQCNKVPLCAQRYTSKLSGPLLDRLDIHIYMERPHNISGSWQKTTTNHAQDSDNANKLCQVVERAWTTQHKRFENIASSDTEKTFVALNHFSCATHKHKQRMPRTFLNGRIPWPQLEPHLLTTSEARNVLEKAEKTWHLSARGLHKVLRLARTLADISGKQNIEKGHIAEALSYRLFAHQHMKQASRHTGRQHTRAKAI